MKPSQSTTGTNNPAFPGGSSALQRFVDQTKQPVALTVGGVVFVEFVVNSDGSIGNPVVLKGLGMEADIEAVRIVLNMPAWIPGAVNGVPAQFKFVLPIDFNA